MHEHGLAKGAARYRGGRMAAAKIRALPANLQWAAWFMPALLFCGCEGSPGQALAPAPAPDNSPPSTTRRFEESDPSVSSSPGWVRSNPDEWFAWSGGRALYSLAPTARATFSFTGRSVTWIGYRSVDSGIARVFIDGAFVADVDLFARRDESGVPIYTVKGLGNGAHTLSIEATGLKNAESQGITVVVDAFDVPARVVSHLQNTDPNVSFSAGWTDADATKPWSGGSAAVSATPMLSASPWTRNKIEGAIS